MANCKLHVLKLSFAMWNFCCGKTRPGGEGCGRVRKKLFTLLDLCVSSLRRGHANLLCIVPILTDDPRRESKLEIFGASKSQLCVPSPRSGRSPHTTAVCGGWAPCAHGRAGPPNRGALFFGGALPSHLRHHTFTVLYLCTHGVCVCVRKQKIGYTSRFVRAILAQGAMLILSVSFQF